MPPPTTSMVPELSTALVALWKGVVPAGVSVWEAWPGPAATQQMVFLDEITGAHRIPYAKAGRPIREETLRITGRVWVFGGTEVMAEDISPAKGRAFEIFAAIEGAMADDVQVGLGNRIEWTQTVEFTATAIAGEDETSKGWAYEIEFHIEGKALLR